MFKVFLAVCGFFLLFVAHSTLHAAVGLFPDVDDQDPHADAISYLKEKNAINGFSDGLLRPERTVNRAEAIKILASVTIDKDSIESCVRRSMPPYVDVHRTDWFAPFVCAAAEKGMIVPGGARVLRPSDSITVAELAAMLTRAYGLQTSGADTPWFAPFVRALGNAKAIPVTLEAAGQNVTRGELAEMIWRLSEHLTDKKSGESERIIGAECEWFESERIPGVDMQEVTRTWLSWVNAERKSADVHPYVQSKQLERTATLWSRLARERGSMSHKRTGQSAYYDYSLITSWFKNLGLTFSNEHSSTFTENIGWGVYNCSAHDCTQKFIESMRTTFDFYMSEKNKADRPHYNSMINKEFRIAGLGIAFDASSHNYYLTAHYATGITSDPNPVCP